MYRSVSVNFDTFSFPSRPPSFHLFPNPACSLRPQNKLCRPSPTQKLCNEVPLPSIQPSKLIQEKEKRLVAGERTEQKE
ncbi:hypothetical protein DL98DRAFT_118816 [Cadophora sp. DSE1049]|nr:hypothetical protein DL98DRAFT_118816 [Cadophora sp. DSE1049]